MARDLDALVTFLERELSRYVDTESNFLFVRDLNEVLETFGYQTSPDYEGRSILYHFSNEFGFNDEQAREWGGLGKLDDFDMVAGYSISERGIMLDDDLIDGSSLHWRPYVPTERAKDEGCILYFAPEGWDRENGQG